MEKNDIDINCDVGEGVGNEKDIMRFISSCNIACGGHTGTTISMKETVRLAQLHKVKIGAHPSYPDKDNFGRTSITMPADDLIKTIRRQIRNLQVVLTNENARLHHIKPHGALYNDIAKSTALAKVFLEGIAEYKTTVFLYVPYASVIEKEALRQGFRIKYEVFADRNYNADLSLVSRKHPEALIVDKEKVLAHLLKIIMYNRVTTLTGDSIKILADTFCIHSDTVLAFEIVSYLTKELPKHNINIQK